MSPRPLRPLAGALALLALVAGFAAARQLRIDVTNFDFTPMDATLNQGDHAVWIWNNTLHTVTSGSTDTFTPDGRFDSGVVTGGTFTWKSTFTGVQPYYCVPHIPMMIGSLTMVGSGAAGLSDFRITEVLFNAAGSLDLVEISNLGSTGNLGMYRLKISGTTMQTLRPSLSSTDLPITAGARIVLHLNASGAADATNLYLPGVSLPDAAGSVALYVPNTVNTSATLADQVIDYVAWGSGGQENEATATGASLWATNTAIAGVAAGHSIEFCGLPGQYGLARWAEIAVPNFGSNGNCTTPTIPSTWGRLKVLYR